MNKAMTIRELAELSGFSRTAVSLALRDSPRVSKANRNKIKALASKHSYRRDTVVSSLMARLRVSRKKRDLDKLAVLTWGESMGVEKSNPFSLQLHNGITQRAATLGYDAEIIWGKEPGMGGNRLSKILYTRGIRGVILMSMFKPRGHVRLDWPCFAAATTGFTIFKPDLHRATSSHYQGMILALRNLRKLGYERVGYLNLIESEDMVNEAWLAAYMAYHYRVHGRVKIPPLLLQAWDKKPMEKWLNKNRPQALVCNSRKYLGLLNELGYQVPKDIGFVLLDCYPDQAECAGIHQNRDRVGAAAVDLVVGQLEANEYGLPAHQKVVMIEPTWKPGATLVPR